MAEVVERDDVSFSRHYHARLLLEVNVRGKGEKKGDPVGFSIQM